MVTAYQVNKNRTARKRFTIGTFTVAIGLLAWGAFVTSINAGMAVPDWPTSFNSYDPFNPWPEWWNITPVFAEHGHRLLGALVGFLTLTLAVWTWGTEFVVWGRLPSRMGRLDSPAFSALVEKPIHSVTSTAASRAIVFCVMFVS